MKKLEKIEKKIIDLVKEYSDIKYRSNNQNFNIVPVSGRVIDSAETINLVKSSLDGFLTSGKFNDEFEKKLSQFLGVKFLITVNSGSSANLVAFSTLCSPMLNDKRINSGDEVICVAAGFPTTINPIIQNGAVPVFVDIELGTYNIDADLIEKNISKKTKAVMIAHTLGNPFNLSKIKKLCVKYNLWLVEDCCDALGSKYDNRLVGTFGDIGTLSFYPAHHITMGEGGAVFTNNPKLKRIAESIRDWGRDCYCKPGCDNTCKRRFSWQLGSLPKGYDHKYTYSNLGYNLKITDMQAACGLAQLDKLDRFIKMRKENFSYLYQNLSQFKDHLMLPVITKNSSPSWFGFPITITNQKIDREIFIKKLNDLGIGTRLLFGGNIIKQPYMSHYKYITNDPLPNTDIVMNRTFWIGLYPGLNKKHFDYVIESFEKIINN